MNDDPTFSEKVLGRSRRLTSKAERRFFLLAVITSSSACKVKTGFWSRPAVYRVSHSFRSLHRLSFLMTPYFTT